MYIYISYKIKDSQHLLTIRKFSRFRVRLAARGEKVKWVHGQIGQQDRIWLQVV